MLRSWVQFPLSAFASHRKWSASFLLVFVFSAAGLDVCHCGCFIIIDLFYFVYLGDIVELACKNAGLGTLDLELPAHINNKGFPIFTNESYFPKDTEISSDEYPLKHARMLLGPLEYYDND